MNKETKSSLFEKTKLLINPDVNKELIETLIDSVESKILRRIKKYANVNNFDEMEDTIYYLILDLVVARYNRIGAEGISSEAMANRSYTYIEEYEEKQIDDVLKDLYGNDDDNGLARHGGFLFIWDMIRQ